MWLSTRGGDRASDSQLRQGLRERRFRPSVRIPALISQYFFHVMTDRCFSSPSSMARKALPTLFIGDTAWRGRPPPSAEFYADVFTDNMRRIIIKMKSLPSETSASPDIASACSMCPENRACCLACCHAEFVFSSGCCEPEMSLLPANLLPDLEGDLC
jgi:hypothetical protein